MTLRPPPFAAVLAMLAVALPPAHAAEPPVPALRTIEFSASAQRAAANDLATAVLYVERAGRNAAELARDANQVVNAALELARGYPAVKLQSLGSATWPVYDKDERARVSGWRLRSDIRLESRDPAAFAELVGKLQASLALAQLNLHPAPATRRAAADEATVDALRAFEQRAALIARTLGKQHRLHQLEIVEDAPAALAPRQMAVMASRMAEAAPLAVEPGETQVNVMVRGRIELLD